LTAVDGVMTRNSQFPTVIDVTAAATAADVMWVQKTGG